MMLWSRRRASEEDAVGTSSKPRSARVHIADECQAFLDGTYARYLVERGKAVPVWAWLNLVAHGDEVQLGPLALGEDDWVPAVWRPALSRLARLATPSVQHDVLVPLELELLATRLVPELTPGQLTSLVEAVLGASPA